MFNKKLYLFVLVGIVSVNAFATDSTKFQSAASFLKKGKFTVQSRSYFMQTNNRKGLTDYYGFATGGGLTYKSPSYKGFSFALGGYFVMNVASSDLEIVDSVTQSPNRYELGLFDVTDPTNRKNLTKLEDLYISYKHKGLSLKYGHFVPDNLFINAQDGRMRPTYVNGLWADWKFKKHQLTFAYLNEISPRSTVKWYSISESLGLYPMGKAINGQASSYLGNIPKTSILISEVTSSYFKNVLKIKIGNITIPNVFQNSYINPIVSYKNWYLGSMFIFQNSLDKSTQEAISKIYFPKSEKVYISSSRIGYKFKKQNINFNYTNISANGRYLMPREWGRDPFYTFIPRERNEGMGGINAFSLNYLYNISKQLNVNFAAGNYLLADVKNSKLNKYSMPSYNQYFLQAEYTCKGWFEGLSIKGLYTYKQLLDKNIKNEKFIFNKVDMGIINLIFNYSISQ